MLAALLDSDLVATMGKMKSGNSEGTDPHISSSSMAALIESRSFVFPS